MLVYLCDYCNRERVSLFLLLSQGGMWDRPTNPGRKESEWAVQRIGIALGHLYHHTLKRHQGIRGYDSLPFFEQARDKTIQELWIAFVEWLGLYVRQSGVAGIDPTLSLDMVLNDVWEKVVKKRNWKSNAESGETVETAQVGVPTDLRFAGGGCCGGSCDKTPLADEPMTETGASAHGTSDPSGQLAETCDSVKTSPFAIEGGCCGGGCKKPLAEQPMTEPK